MAQKPNYNVFIFLIVVVLIAVLVSTFATSTTTNPKSNYSPIRGGAAVPFGSWPSKLYGHTIGLDYANQFREAVKFSDGYYEMDGLGFHISHH